MNNSQSNLCANFQSSDRELSQPVARNDRACGRALDGLTLLKLTLGLLLGLALPTTVLAINPGLAFKTPEDAVAKLEAATSTMDTNALRHLFGSAATAIQNPDRVQATNELASFNVALRETNYLMRASNTKLILEVGDDLWPFPIPLVQTSGGWRFDTQAGKQELLNRRIGRNELDVLAAIRAYVDAQREYASQYRDRSGVLKYAQRINSSPGRTDGLYWPVTLNGEESPLGPLVADAQQQGYSLKRSNSNARREPFHGYYFKILTRQGKHAPGGKYDYIINGNMIGGFALVAWPADYGNSGIMTFIVNQQGKVYQKDLGRKTESIVRGMKAYDPDKTWQISHE